MEIDWTLISSVLGALGLGAGGQFLSARVPKEWRDKFEDYKSRFHTMENKIDRIEYQLKFENDVKLEVERRLYETHGTSSRDRESWRWTESVGQEIGRSAAARRIEGGYRGGPFHGSSPANRPDSITSQGE